MDQVDNIRCRSFDGTTVQFHAEFNTNNHYYIYYQQAVLLIAVLLYHILRPVVAVVALAAAQQDISGDCSVAHGVHFTELMLAHVFIRIATEGKIDRLQNICRSQDIVYYKT